MSRHICLVATEASGEILGAEVIDALRMREPAIRITVIGDGEMASRGERLPVDLSDLAVVGLIDGLKAFSRVKAKVEACASLIAAADPDAVVLIDSWGFMWRLAARLQALGVRARRIKLIGPQVWATRPGRARILAKHCDHLFCIHAFEAPFFEKWGLPVTVIGNPALSRRPRVDVEGFRHALGVPPGARLIGVLPGSRRAEIRRVAPVLAEAAVRLKAEMPNLQIVCVAARPVEDAVRGLEAFRNTPVMFVPEGDQKASAFAAMDVALACSGTVTTELAALGTPMLVGYRLGWLTWAIARLFLMKARYITLLNVAANKEVAPEFIQTRFTSGRFVAAARRLLQDESLRRAQIADQNAALAAMAGGDRASGDIVAEGVLDQLR